MRPRLLAALLLAPLLAGCLGAPQAPSQPPAEEPDEPPARNATSPAPAPPPAPRPPAPRRVSLGGPSNEVSIAVDASDPRRVLVGAKDYSLFFAPPCPQLNVWAGLYVSLDGGRLWRHTVLPGFPGDPRPSVLAGYRCASDPVVLFDAQGTAYYAGLAYGFANDTGPAPQPPPLPPPPVPLPPVQPPQPPNATLPAEPPTPTLLFLAKSRDGGLNWNETYVVAEDKAGLIFHDKEALALDAGTLYMAWNMQVRELPTIVVARSTDGGATWSAPLPVATNPPARTVFGAALAAANGKVHLVFLGTDAQGTTHLYATLSEDQGQRFAPAVPIAPVSLPPSPLPNSQFRVPTVPSLAADATGLLMVAWNDHAGGTSDVVVSASRDGASWSQPAVVHAEPANDQFFPALAFNGTEALLLFYDRRGDPANRLVQVGLARSQDGGTSWNETLLNQAPFDGDLSHHQSGGPFLGDYIGLAAAAGQAWAAWTATPFARGDVFVLRVS